MSKIEVIISVLIFVTGGGYIGFILGQLYEKAKGE